MTPDMDILGAEDSAELARRIHGGDRAAEARFAHLYCDCVFALALARTHDRAAARELMDDVLMAVVLALRHGAVRQEQRLGGFVHGTAVNTINGYFRRRRRQLRTVTLDTAMAVTSSAEDLEEDDRHRAVRSALALLQERDRQILRLSLEEGLRPGEIAARLGLSAVVVRQRKCRALRTLVASVGSGAAKVGLRGMLRR